MYRFLEVEMNYISVFCERSEKARFKNAADDNGFKESKKCRCPFRLIGNWLSLEDQNEIKS